MKNQQPDPLDFLGSAGAVTQEDPLDFLGGSSGVADFSTAPGRKQADEESRAKLVAQYTESLKNPNLTPEHKARLEKGIAENKSSSALGIFEIPRVEDTKRTSIENFGRGLGAGAVHGVTGLVDLVGAASNAALPGQPLQGLRRWAATTGAEANETFDPQGKSGLLGDVAGSLVSGAPGYGKIANISGELIGKAVPKLAPVIEKALSGNLLQRVTGQALIDAPLNVLQAATLEDASFEDKAKVLALGVGGSVVGGVLPGKKLPKGIGDATVKPGDADALADLPGARVASRAEEAAKLIEQGVSKREARKATIQLEREARKAARAEWSKANPDKSWQNDLSKNERADLVKKYQALSEVPKAETVVPPDGESQGDLFSPATGVASVAPKFEPPQLGNIKSHPNGDTSYEFHAPGGNVVTVKGRMNEGDTGTFWVSAIESTGGRNSLGKQAVASLKQQIQDLTGTTKVKGERVYKNAANKTVHGANAGSVENLQQVDVGPATNQAMWEDLSSQPIHTSPELVQQAVAQIKEVPTHDREVLDKVFKQLQYLHKAGDITPEDALLLQNLEAIHIEMSTQGKGEMPTVVIGKKEPPNPVEPEYSEQAVHEARAAKITTAAKESGLDPTTVIFDEEMGFTDAGRPLVRQFMPDDYRHKIRTVQDVIDYNKPKPRTTPIPAQATEPRASPPEAPSSPRVPSTPDTTPGFLSTVEHDKPLSEINSMDELDDLKGEVWDQMKIGSAGEIPASEAHLADLDALGQRTRELHAEAKAAAKMTQDPAAGFVTTTAKPKDSPIGMPGSEFGKTIRTPANKLNLDQATRLLEELELRTSSMSPHDKVEYTAKMNELRERKAVLTSQGRTEGGLNLYSRNEVGGAIVGFMSGMVTGDTDEERFQNAAVGALIGAGSAYGLTKLFNPKVAPSMVPKKVLESVKTLDELNQAKPETGMMERARWIYQRAIRPAVGGEHFTKQATQGASIPAARDPGKMLASFGKWIAQSESWLTGRPFIEMPDGTSIELPVKNAKEIAELVAGDTEGLGKLAAARTALELYATKGRKTPGIDLVEAQRLVAALPEQYHQAADAMRQLHIGLLESLVQGGVLSRESVAKMSQEKYYAALERAFGSSYGNSVDAIKKLKIDSPNPVKERTRGSSAPIKNPYETMISNIARTHRAIEINKIKDAMIDLAEASPEIGAMAFKRIDRNTKGKDGKPLVSDLIEQRVEALKDDLDISTDEAQRLVAAYAGDNLNPNDPTMTMFRDGHLRTYRVRRDIAESFRALRPEERGDIEKMLALPTSVARAGIVNNPVFIARQAWRDNWQAMMNSQHGFVWGLDWVRGYMESAFESKNFKEFTKGGGGSTSFAFTDILSQEKAIAQAKSPGKNAFDTAFRRIKELQPGEAWHALVVPMAEAARMGEYLRARGRGAEVAEAVFAAKSVVGNFQQHGSTLRALSGMALFLNPSLQALDQAIYSAGVNPFRPAPTSKGFKFGPYTLLENTLEGRNAAAVNYVTKAVAGITVPSLLLWAAYHDDQEIQELRGSETGRGFWFWRDTKGELHKAAKPIFEGQLFGTTAELAADKFMDEKPVEATAFASAMMHDAAVNLLPTIGVVAGSLWANKDYNTGGEIAPAGPDPQFQATANSSLPARVVAKSIAPVSEWMQNVGGSFLTEPVADALSRAMTPAGIDYVVRNLGGTLAQEALRGVGQAIVYKDENYLPPATEWPVIRGALVSYPTTNTASIQKFYRDAERVDHAAKSMAVLAQADPQGMIEYYNQHSEAVGLIDLYAKTRTQIADLRQAIQDIKGAPAGTFQREDTREIEKQIILRMIETARLANDAAILLK